MFLDVLTVKDVKNKIAELSKLLRKNEGLSQGELAEKLDISRITVQNMEAGKNVTLDTLLKTLQYFSALEKFDEFIKENIEVNSLKSLY